MWMSLRRGTAGLAYLIAGVLSLAFLSMALPGNAFADPRVGAVFSTGQTSSQSFVRIYNGDSSANTVAVTLADFGTGQVLGQWISPSIPGGAEQQFDIKTIESALGPITKPYYYSMNVQSNFAGYFQHVLWKPSDGTLTNLSTCASGVTAAATTLVGVHSSLLNYAYPSTVVVNNTGAQATGVTLGIYDARDGTKLGVYTTSSIPAGGSQILPMSSMESAIGRTPSGSMYHYVLKTESVFTGFLQHLVSNLQAGVTTDMTTECAMNGAVVAPAAAPVRIGAVFSTAQLSSRSYVRFYNTSPSAGTATVTLRDQSSGQILGTWNSPFISPGAEVQYGIDVLESAFNGVAKPSYYAISVQASFTGYVQHVLWRVSDGTLTNLSTCDRGVTADKANLIGVHSSLLGGRYPSGVVINNTGASSQSVTIGVYDARDGTKLGTYTTPQIPNNAQFMLSAASLEVAIGKAPTDGMYHYVVKAEGPFTGFLQHLVNNLQAAVITDMTTTCALS
jgi:hypothetical protein